MRPLSGLDAGFLSLETPNAPMLIGGVAILDPSTPGGRLGLEGFRALLARRLSRAVAFRRRLAAVPLDLARPYWVELAPEAVDLGYHLERTELPAPGAGTSSRSSSPSRWAGRWISPDRCGRWSGSRGSGACPECRRAPWRW